MSAAEIASDHVPNSTSKSNLSESIELPNPHLRWTILACIGLHFFALLLTFAANFGQSLAISGPLRWFNHYLISSGQNYGARPVEWTHAADYEAPLRVQILENSLTETPGRWQDVDVAQFGGRWKNASRYLGLVMEDDSESELISEFTLRLLQASTTGENARQVRLLRAYVPSFDEQQAIVAGQSEYFGDAIQPTVLFQAQVVRSESDIVGLVPVLSEHRMSPPRNDDSSVQAGS